MNYFLLEVKGKITSQVRHMALDEMPAHYSEEPLTLSGRKRRFT